MEEVHQRVADDGEAEKPTYLRIYIIDICIFVSPPIN